MFSKIILILFSLFLFCNSLFSTNHNACINSIEKIFNYYQEIIITNFSSPKDLMKKYKDIKKRGEKYIIENNLKFNEAKQYREQIKLQIKNEFLKDLENYLKSYNFFYAKELVYNVDYYSILSDIQEDQKVKNLFFKYYLKYQETLNKAWKNFFEKIVKKSWDIHFVTSKEYVNNTLTQLRKSGTPFDEKPTIKLQEQIYKNWIKASLGKDSIKKKKIKFNFESKCFKHIDLKNIARNFYRTSESSIYYGWSDFYASSKCIENIKKNYDEGYGSEFRIKEKIFEQINKYNLENLKKNIEENLILKENPGIKKEFKSCEVNEKYFLFIKYGSIQNSNEIKKNFLSEIILILPIKQSLLEIEIFINLQNYIGKIDNLKQLCFDIAETLKSSFLALMNELEEDKTIKINLIPETSVNLSPYPDKNSTCKLKIIATDIHNKPLSNVNIKFKKPVYGKLSQLTINTNSQGEGSIIFTAPDENIFEKIEKNEINVILEAEEPKSGEKSRVEIHIRSKKKKINIKSDYNIIPAHKDYFNRIMLKLNVANKPDGSPYNAMIAVKDNSYGVLLKSKNENGTKKLNIKIYPQKNYYIFYHWIGHTDLQKPFLEEITIEIPELKLKEKINFSIGIDLMIEAVTPKYGNNIFTGLYNPVNIYVKDNFHPNADIEKLFKNFGLNIGLSFKVAYHKEMPPDALEEGFLKTFYALWKNTDSYPKINPIFYDGPMWYAKKTKDNRYKILFKAKNNKKRYYLEYPGFIVFDSGNYQFEITLDADFDSNISNNNILTDVFEVNGFSSENEEIFCNILLPSIEFLLLSASDMPLIKVEGLSKTTLAAINMHLTAIDFVNSIKKKNFKKALFDVFSGFIGAIDDSKLTKEIHKKALAASTAVIYEITLFTSIYKLYKKNNSFFKNLFSLQTLYAENFYRKKYSEKEIIEVLKTILQTKKEYYLILIYKDSLKNYIIKNKTGLIFKTLNKNFYKKPDINKRIVENKNFIALYGINNEKIILDLEGDDSKGKVLIITPNNSFEYIYPKGKWRLNLNVTQKGFLN